MSTPNETTFGDAPAPRRALTTGVIAGIIGLGVGVAFGALVLGGDSDDEAEPLQAAELDVEAGCMLVSIAEDYPELDTDDSDDTDAGDTEISEPDTSEPDTSEPESPDDEDDEDDEWGLDGPHIWRYQAIAGAFQAAGNVDGAYAAAAEDADTMLRALNTLRIDELNRNLGNLRDFCRDRTEEG